MFKITGGKGFHVTFANGYTVSVQFGPGNYGDHYNADINDRGRDEAGKGSMLAEMAVWGPDGNFIDGTPLEIAGGVAGYKNPEDMLRLMQWAEAQPVRQTAPA